jgi:hypothetical protein
MDGRLEAFIAQAKELPHAVESGALVLDIERADILDKLKWKYLCAEVYKIHHAFVSCRGSIRTDLTFDGESFDYRIHPEHEDNGYRPYKFSNISWVGRVIIYKDLEDTQDSGLLITEVEGSMVYAGSNTRLTLDDLFKDYLWYSPDGDHKVCGILKANNTH